MAPATIRFTDPEAWENQRQKVDQILQEETGTSDYASTKSLPPIIFGADLKPEAIEKLRKLEGVVVQLQDEDD